MNSYYYGRKKFHADKESDTSLLLAFVAIGAISIGGWLAVEVYRIRTSQIVAASVYLVFLLGATLVIAWYYITKSARLSERWPHPAIVIPVLTDNSNVLCAAKQDAIVLGYDLKRNPWFWQDRIRVMQSLLIGQSGAGKTTLLKNIVTQDVYRRYGSADEPRRIPMIIMGGKGDPDDLNDLIPHIAAAGRLHQLRILDPSRPDISARYNPFFSKDERYQEHVSFIFESFALKQDFFSGHQAAYLSDLARVLWHGGKRFNIHDVLVTALDPVVMKEQVQIAKARLESASITTQRKLNFEMSVRNLYQSLEDRDRVPKIQGLLNELMTFLEDELSIVTGHYDQLLTLDDVIDQELILFISLNTNRNSRAVTALGRMLLQNMQLIVGKRYDDKAKLNEQQPIVSVVLDEFAPFAYPKFAQTLQTARGSNVAFLFSLQSVSQLETVSRGFRHDVLSAPNTVMMLRTRDEESTRYFLNASARIKAERRTMTVEKHGLFQEQYTEMGFGSVSEVERTRAEDFRIKNLPVGQMEILQTDSSEGTLHSHLYVRRPVRNVFTKHAWIPNQATTPSLSVEGANLRFKSPEAVQRYSRIQGRKKLADLIIK